MSQQGGTASNAAAMQQGSLMFAAGMALAVASVVVELAIVRFFSK
jgi:hypothetical protein